MYGGGYSDDGRIHTFIAGTEINIHDFGTGFAANINLLGEIINFKPVNPQISSLRSKEKGHNYTLISGHARTEDQERVLKINFITY